MSEKKPNTSVIIVGHFHGFRKDIPLLKHLDQLIETYAKQGEKVSYFKLAEDLKPLLEREMYDICKYRFKEQEPVYSLVVYRMVEIVYSCSFSRAIEVLTVEMPRIKEGIRFHYVNLGEDTSCGRVIGPAKPPRKKRERE